MSNNYSNSKSTKRFTFNAFSNPTSKKAGSNIVTISTNPTEGKYSTGTASLTMTHKEAKVLQSWLNTALIVD
ncbi:MAG TPA: hypothetical protein EYG51_16875 [Pseudomonadales bacterium]|nr:hypothetical protein [Pseudomonadales bacterium]